VKKKPTATSEKDYPVITLRSPEHRPLKNAYSRPLRRGALGDIDARTKEGRFLSQIQADLGAQLGGSPSLAQQLLIRRIARSMLMLEVLDLRLASGEWNECSARTQGGLQNSVRLNLRELGIRAAHAPKKTLAADLAAKAGK
jgi:hypothetical protein